MASDITRLRSLLNHITTLCTQAQNVINEIERKQKNRTEKKIINKIVIKPDYKSEQCPMCKGHSWRYRIKTNTKLCLLCGYVKNETIEDIIPQLENIGETLAKKE